VASTAMISLKTCPTKTRLYIRVWMQESISWRRKDESVD
jgi:hypothetical protein